MIALGGRRLFLCCQPVDMRKGFDGLATLVLGSLQRDPRCGDAFAFISRRRTMLKLLCWNGDGFWVCAKRLASGRFSFPLIATGEGKPDAVTLTASEWQLLLDGIVVRDRVVLPRYSREIRGA